MDSIWSNNGGQNSWHFLVAVYFAFGFVFVRFFLDKFLFRRVAVWLVRSGYDERHAKVVKCSESLWKLTYYTCAQVFILKSVYKEPWFTHSQHYFTSWPHQELKVPVDVYYKCQCGFYMYSIVALLAWETRRKDFAVMMSHHVLTVILIGFSYLSRLFQIGTIVLCLHDASDIFLEAAKVLKYSEKELAASVIFGCFAVSWLILRLIFFPFWIIKSSSYDFGQLFNLEDVYLKFIYYIFNTMLLMLLNFHIYWWILICSMIRRQLKNSGKISEDIRSDSEDED